MIASIAWDLSDPDKDGLVTVRERMEGTDLMNTFGPMPRPIADTFIKARREVFARLASKAGAVRLFIPTVLH